MNKLLRNMLDEYKLSYLIYMKEFESSDEECRMIACVRMSTIELILRETYDDVTFDVEDDTTVITIYNGKRKYRYTIDTK